MLERSGQAGPMENALVVATLFAYSCKFLQLSPFPGEFSYLTSETIAGSTVKLYIHLPRPVNDYRRWHLRSAPTRPTLSRACAARLRTSLIKIDLEYRFKSRPKDIKFSLALDS